MILGSNAAAKLPRKITTKWGALRATILRLASVIWPPSVALVEGCSQSIRCPHLRGGEIHLVPCDPELAGCSFSSGRVSEEFAELLLLVRCALFPSSFGLTQIGLQGSSVCIQHGPVNSAKGGRHSGHP